MYRKSMREALEEARAYRDPVNEASYSTQQIRMAYGILNDPRYKQGNYSGAVRAIEKIAKGLSNHPDVANALRRANEELQEASKFLRYSNLLIQKGRMQRAGDKQGERLTDIEIEKEKKKLGIRDEFIPEGMVKRVMQTVHDKLSKEGGAAGFDDLAKVVKKEFGINISKDTLKNMPGVKQHRDGDYILEQKEQLDEFTRADFDKLEADNEHGEAAKKLVQKFGTPEEKKEIDAINKRHKLTGYIKGPDYQRRYQITNKYFSRLR
tara:strand:+ start:396 stop:1190 length:795 start_codon:yes stop_codon:yes gene_type:complete